MSGFIWSLFSFIVALGILVFIHEFGHHFAGLADEYYTSSAVYSPSNITVEPYEPNVTALLNGQTKWQSKIKNQTPLPTSWPKQAYEKHSYEYQKVRRILRQDNKPESEMDKLFHHNQKVIEEIFSKAQNNNVIGAFEGANYSAKGYYRSELNCIMFTRTTDFCQVCQHSITDMINFYSSH